jgi:hypothetical protein
MEAALSSDALFLDKLVRALRELRIDAIIVGNTGSILHGAPVLTQDVDLLVRDRPANRNKIRECAAKMGGVESELSELANARRIVGAELPIDFIFDRIGPLLFTSVKKRSVVLSTGTERARVASLEDIIESKRSLGRKKDLAVLPILEDTLAVVAALRK